MLHNLYQCTCQSKIQTEHYIHRPTLKCFIFFILINHHQKNLEAIHNIHHQLTSAIIFLLSPHHSPHSTILSFFIQFLIHSFSLFHFYILYFPFSLPLSNLTYTHLYISIQLFFLSSQVNSTQPFFFFNK